jgi:hypothetical protein
MYLDQRANQQQAEALTGIFSDHAGGWPAVLGSLMSGRGASYPAPPPQIPPCSFVG